MNNDLLLANYFSDLLPAEFLTIDDPKDDHLDALDIDVGVARNLSLQRLIQPEKPGSLHLYAFFFVLNLSRNLPNGRLKQVCLDRCVFHLHKIAEVASG